MGPVQCGASSHQHPCLLNRWRMGKGSTKKKPKWKSLELETPPATTTSTATSATTPPEQGLDPQHPFLKMISKNVDGAVISTEKQQQQQGANEGNKPIHLYRSSRHLGVPPSAPSSQYVGAPIQYCPTKWVDHQANQHMPPQEVLLQTAGPEVVYPPVATAEVISEVASQEMYQQMGSQEVYQHPVVYQEVQRPEVYQPTSHKSYTVQAGVTYQVPTVAVERNGLTEYVPDPKQVPGLNYFEQNGLTEYAAASPPASQEYAASYTASTSDYTSEYILSSPDCVSAAPEFPPHPPPALSAELALVPPPAQYVQYVPYYFYYPVGVPANVDNSNDVAGPPVARVRSQPVVLSQTSSSSSASSDSYAVRSERKGGGRRRRRKRGESEGKLEKVPMEAALGDVDSGYLNGEESSSEQGSEREGEEEGEAEVTDSGMEVEQEIKELLIDQVTNPAPVDVQFGEVAEILEQLRIGEAQDVSVEDVEVNVDVEVEVAQNEEVVNDRELLEDIVNDPHQSENEGEEETQCTLITNNAEEVDTSAKSAEKRRKKKEKKKKSKKARKASSVELVKEEVEEEEGEAKKDEKTGVEPTLVSGEGKPEPLVIAEDKWESVELFDVPVPADAWTEVNISRKKKGHNNHVTFSQTVEALEPKEDVTPVEESITNHSQEVAAEEVGEEKAKEKKVTKPLEEIKDLFFHEKPVEIVELARPERTEKVPTKRRIRQKAKSKRAFLSDAKKASQPTSSQRRSRTAPAASAGPETSALPFLVFQPFGSFLHDQSRSAEDRVEEDWRQMLAPPVGLCVQGSLARPTCPLEEQLVMQRAIPRRERVEVGPVPRPVVMIREQARMGGMLGKRPGGVQHVPGPRLQYSPGCRTGPLGVTRRVVPPFSLTQRLSVF